MDMAVTVGSLSLSHSRSGEGVSRPRSTPGRTTCVEGRLS